MKLATFLVMKTVYQKSSVFDLVCLISNYRTAFVQILVLSYKLVASLKCVLCHLIIIV